MTSHTWAAVHGFPAQGTGFVGENEVRNPYLVLAAQGLSAVMTDCIDLDVPVFPHIALPAFPGHHASPPVNSCSARALISSYCSRDIRPSTSASSSLPRRSRRRRRDGSAPTPDEPLCWGPDEALCVGRNEPFCAVPDGAPRPSESGLRTSTFAVFGSRADAGDGGSGAPFPCRTWLA